EAEAVARLQHPNIVQIFEVGQVAGRPYLTLEYVAGGTLAQFLDRKPQPVALAADLARTLAAAVEHAHTHGILHRDLKPANILLQKKFTAEGAEGAERKPESKTGSAKQEKQLSSSAPSAPSAVNL